MSKAFFDRELDFTAQVPGYARKDCLLCLYAFLDATAEEIAGFNTIADPLAHARSSEPEPASVISALDLSE